MDNQHQPDGAFPKDEDMYRDVARSLDQVGLNSEVLVTIIKEVSRLSRQANHEQIHVLINVIQAILASLAFAHQVIVVREGGHEHGRH